MRALQYLVRPRSRSRPLLIGAIAILSLAAVLLAVAGYRSVQRLGDLEKRGQRLRQAQKTAQVQPSRTEIELQKRWSALAADRAFPWPAVFRAVEHAVDPDIELLEFRPDKRQRALTLKGAAKSEDAILRYLDALAAERPLVRVFLVRQAEVRRGRLVTLEFEIRATIAELIVQ
jgi:Tfp pilus assembly protein PilN